MKLKRLILVTAAAGICYSSTVTASHLGEFHGLRSSASLAKQNKKNREYRSYMIIYIILSHTVQIHELFLWPHRFLVVVSNHGAHHRSREHPLLPESHTNDIETLLEERKNEGDKSSGSSYGLRASASLARKNRK